MDACQGGKTHFSWRPKLIYSEGPGHMRTHPVDSDGTELSSMKSRDIPNRQSGDLVRLEQTPYLDVVEADPSNVPKSQEVRICVHSNSKL